MRGLDYLSTRGYVGGGLYLVGDGPHGVIALYAAALDERVRGVALMQTVTDYRSLAVAERYSQPFGIYAYGLLQAFDLPDVASAVAPRRVLLLDASTPLGAPAGSAARDLYAGVTNASVRTTGDDDPVQILTSWLGGAGGSLG
jgi:pimeloyl-ACP methyl ester carboxylesterase